METPLEKKTHKRTSTPYPHNTLNKSTSFHFLATDDKSDEEEILESKDRKLSTSSEKNTRKRKISDSDSDYDTDYEENSMSDYDNLNLSIDTAETLSSLKNNKNFMKKYKVFTRFSGSFENKSFKFTGKETNERKRKSESFEEGENTDLDTEEKTVTCESISDSEEEKENLYSKNLNSKSISDSDEDEIDCDVRFIAKIADKKSKSKTFGESENFTESTSRSCKSLGRKSLQTLNSDDKAEESEGYHSTEEKIKPKIRDKVSEKISATNQLQDEDDSISRIPSFIFSQTSEIEETEDTSKSTNSEDSEDEPESLSFAEVRQRVAEDMKKKVESIKAGKDETRNKKKILDEYTKKSSSKKRKRLTGETLQELEDIPRSKKRQKVPKKENSYSSLQEPRPGSSLRKRYLNTPSLCGSTTKFEVVNLLSKNEEESC